MAARSQGQRNQFRVMVGLALIGGIAAASMACGTDEVVTRGLEAEPQVRVVADSPEERRAGAEYVFVDVGAWDDTNIEWNVSHSLAEPRSTDFMDVERELGHQYADAVIRGQSAATNPSDLHRVGNWYEDEFAAAQPKNVDLVDVERELGHQYFDAAIRGQSAATNPSELHRVGNWYEDEFVATR